MLDSKELNSDINSLKIRFNLKDIRLIVLALNMNLKMKSKLALLIVHHSHTVKF
jgi:hypothetical protein